MFPCIIVAITAVFLLAGTFILKGYFVLFHCGALGGERFDMMFLQDSLEEGSTVLWVKCICSEWQQQPFLRNYIQPLSLFSSASGVSSSEKLSSRHMEK